MTKLHELLAVEQNLRTQAEVTRKDLMNTFEKKRHHFHEVKTTFKSKDEGVPEKLEEQLDLQTTIKKELDWVSEKIAAMLDVGYQIDVANTVAKADVILSDGSELLNQIPATTLLQLEKRIVEIQQLIKSIPTLDPAKGFKLDPDRGADIYKAKDVEKQRTKKEFSYVVMVQPTKEHPAQVKELMLDKVIGDTLQQEWCSLITTTRKSEMLDRVEEVLRAVKKARSRANEIEIDVKTNKISENIIDYILKL